MKSLAVMIVLGLCGCSPYTRVQIGLVEQARRGVQLWKQREAGRDAVERADFDHRRAQLDRAFDDDVRRLPPGELSAEWIIDARKAYAAAMDILAQARTAALAANDAARRNAQATDAALQKLLWLESIELELQSVFESRTSPGEQP